MDGESVEDLEAEFFDHRVGQDVLGDSLHLGFGFLAAQAIQRKNEKFSLAHVLNRGISQRRQALVEWFDPGDPELWFSA